VHALGILEYLTSRRRLVPQEPLGFGEPPITVYRGRDFYISALYWLDGTTSIHQHGFSGAFRVLVGSSIHAEYAFARQEAVNSRLLVGDLGFAGAELLRPGDVRPIRAGDAFIHALFHLERPSVTIVIRTDADDVGTPQFRYYRPGLAFDPFYEDETLDRQLLGLSTLHAIDPDGALRVARDMISATDLFGGLLVTKRWFTLDKGERVEALIDHAVRCHGPAAEILRPAFDEQRRLYYLIARRRFLHDAGHRLFLALLLNLPDRASVDAILRQRFPDRDPAEMLAGWLEELSAPDLRGVSGLQLDDATRGRLRGLLAGGEMAPVADEVRTTPLLELLLA
jgi:hypothetical protein